jgi:hypothetical protein
VIIGFVMDGLPIEEIKKIAHTAEAAMEMASSLN